MNVGGNDPHRREGTYIILFPGRCIYKHQGFRAIFHIEEVGEKQTFPCLSANLIVLE